ncbi:hypothetical protein O0544_14260 [Edwardsiella anguillarum]|nr:hypothetical protein [Edwardsiella anguillarum]MDA6077132.1 hypothetical protein [Edwardsiella anguillarum]
MEPDDVLQPSLIPDYLDQLPGTSTNRENLLANYSVALHQDHTLQLGYQFFREQSQRSQYYTLSLFSRLPGISISPPASTTPGTTSGAPRWGSRCR